MSGLLAHAGGHWATSLIYLLPFVAVFLWLGWQKLKGESLTSWDEEPDASAERDAPAEQRDPEA